MRTMRSPFSFITSLMLGQVLFVYAPGSGVPAEHVTLYLPLCTCLPATPSVCGGGCWEVVTPVGNVTKSCSIARAYCLDCIAAGIRRGG